jgi:iron complex transport system substrate-binding protein
LFLAPGLLRAEVRRVVSLVPSHTDIVDALGAGDLLVGVADADKGRDALPRAGGLAPRWEVFVSLKPDLVLADVSHRRFAPDFQRHKIPARFFNATRAGNPSRTCSRSSWRWGPPSNGPTEARRLVSDLTARVARIDARLPIGRPPRAIFELWPRPLQVAGQSSLPGHLLERAGFVNIAPPTRERHPPHLLGIRPSKKSRTIYSTPGSWPPRTF